ncbi:MAG: hypothetical protein PHT60_11750 [Acidiphilium sp.]|nr:hypothetical protein [Acidiphilium sp.]MDD4936437.1 hypothetical protein [Acidiphilium sp.]
MPTSNKLSGKIPLSLPDEKNYAATLLQRVRILIERGQLNAASLLLPTLDTLYPNQDAGAIIAAEIALARGNITEASTAIDRGLANTPQSAGLLILRARLNLLSRDLIGAALAAADAVTAEPANAEAKSLLGRALLELGMKEQATICLREALGDMPHDVLTLTALSRASPADAEAAIRRALLSGTNDTTMRNALIGVMLARGDIDGATAEIKNLTVSGTADAQTSLLAVQAAVDSENWGDAVSLFNQSTVHLPRHA